MPHEDELEKVTAEIALLKEKLNKIYDEQREINNELLETSVLLDEKINLYMKLTKSTRDISCT